MQLIIARSLGVDTFDLARPEHTLRSLLDWADHLTTRYLTEWNFIETPFRNCWLYIDLIATALDTTFYWH